MQRSLVAAITALLLGIVGGAAAPVDPATSVRPSPQIRLTAGELIRISPAGTCSVTGDFEGVFGPKEMPTYLQCIVPIVDGWIDQVYQSMPHPNAYYFVPPGVTGLAEGAPGCPYDEGSLMYCPVDRGVYLGATAVWQQYSQFGDAAPPTILAHEVTHHFQNMRGIWPGSDSIPMENQADCGAGAFMAYSRNMGLMARDDIRDLALSLDTAGEAEGPDRVHGTPIERLTSFDTAYLSNQPNPLFACNFFVSETPLIA